MSEKTVSQKIARVFEIVDYFLLVPSLAGLFFGIAMLGDKNSFLFGLAICVVFIIGTVLLVGYFKHSRGRLSEKATAALWIGTILFNALFLLPTLFFMIRDFNQFLNERSFSGGMIFTPYVLIVLWWTIAISGSVIALKSLRSAQKYR
ncbi:hypothetical protein BH20ACI4_BH20ACI4_25390 [soil metagenome]